MRATLVSRTTVCAVVRLEPGWLGRLFGARAVMVELERCGSGWRTAGTGKFLCVVRHGAAIERALDFVQVAQLPAMRVTNERTT